MSFTHPASVCPRASCRVCRVERGLGGGASPLRPWAVQAATGRPRQVTADHARPRRAQESFSRRPPGHWTGRPGYGASFHGSPEHRHL